MFEITAEQIMLNQSYASWEEALAASGELLLKNQLVTPDYVKQVLKEGICFIQVPDGVNFGTEADRKIATLLFVVALKSQQQLSMLQELAFFCSDLENIQRLSDCQTIDEAQKILAQA